LNPTGKPDQSDHKPETILVLVGFLGAGKTTLLKELTDASFHLGFQPFVILNDYANADIEASILAEGSPERQVLALNGSCICCDGIGELRESVNSIKPREKGITIIEANGTSDVFRLMGFLGVGLNDRFEPPFQISVVDVKNWQSRGEHNELERNQVQTASAVILSHLDKADEQRVAEVKKSILELNPNTAFVSKQDLETLLKPRQSINPQIATENKSSSFDHKKSHWASCSVDLPNLPHPKSIQKICDSIPDSVLRVKGCTKIGSEPEFTYFERTPDGEVYVRPCRSVPTTGPKLLTIGPGSDPQSLSEIVNSALQAD